ncbi:MAG: hypothetical protein DMF82_21540, partial [Acidobacteria bacterium]
MPPGRAGLDKPCLPRVAVRRSSAPEPRKESSMRRSVAVPLTLLAFLAILFPVRGHAQSFNGSISGKVLDSTGAVVAGAELVLKNAATGVELRRKSTDSGDYAFRNLVPGNYELRASSAGFKPHVQK